jgi:hypothetical protein
MLKKIKRLFEKQDSIKLDEELIIEDIAITLSTGEKILIPGNKNKRAGVILTENCLAVIQANKREIDEIKSRVNGVLSFKDC